MASWLANDAIALTAGQLSLRHVHFYCLRTEVGRYNETE